MSQVPAISVKVPFGSGKHRFKILKAQRWGAVDKLLLQAIAIQPRSAQQLAEHSGLPRQLIIEIMIPFMRIGWVELIQINQYYAFQATDSGKAIADYDELPVEKNPLSRVRHFLIDPVTGQCYRLERKKQLFQVYYPKRATELLQSRIEYVTELKFESNCNPRLIDIFSCVANEDEEVIGFDESMIQQRYNQNTQYAIALVDAHNSITGLPPDVSEELKDQVLQAAQKKRDAIRLLGAVSSSESKSLSYYDGRSKAKSFESHEVNSDQYNLVLGGEVHKQHLEDMILNAQSHLIIHSTFIHMTSFEQLIPLLLDAARRSVQIDILWGQTEPEEESKQDAYQKVIDGIKRIQQRIDQEGLSTQLSIHRQPSGSHAKIIICDHNAFGYCATFGSCNWLSSTFNRFEASVCLYQPNLVIEALDLVSLLAMGSTNVANDLSKELAVLASRLKEQPKRQSRDCGSATEKLQVRLILESEHHRYVRDARDQAKREIFVCSHRISHVVDRPILAPLKAAIQQPTPVQVSIAYGRTSAGMKSREMKTLAQELQSLGFRVEKADDPMIHAKILTWDDDHALITSLNWLSAAATGDSCGELGVYLLGDNVAQKIKKSFIEETGKMVVQEY